MVEINARAHRATRRPPVEMLAEEQQRLHRLPDVAYTAVFGETRKVSWSATISYGGVTYSVPTRWPMRRCGCVSMATRSSSPTARRQDRSKWPGIGVQHQGTR